MNDVMRRSILVLAALGLMLGACTNTTPTNARVSGLVAIGPTCPFGTCPDRPVPGIRIIFAGASTQTATAVTDSSGAFAVTLAPGDYDVTLAGPNALLFQVSGSLGPPSESAKIHTTSGQELRVNFRLFSSMAKLERQVRM